MAAPWQTAALASNGDDAHPRNRVAFDQLTAGELCPTRAEETAFFALPGLARHLYPFHSEARRDLV